MKMKTKFLPIILLLAFAISIVIVNAIDVRACIGDTTGEAFARGGCVITDNSITEDLIVISPNEPLPKFDVVFLIDSTGSMSDEIRSVKTHIINIVNDVRDGQPAPEMRIGVVTYRDHEPEELEYLFDYFDLTYDIDSALEFIEQIQANGGGDMPEAVADGLHYAVRKMDWDSDHRKIIFLIGDAPPHGEGSSDSSHEQGCPNHHNYKDEVEEAVDNDITIYTISGSGMDYVGEKIWEEIARETGGAYEKLSYDRQDIDQYYKEEKIDRKYLAEAKEDADYDAETNTIVTNSMKMFARGALMQEAEAMGVRYDNSPSPSNPKIDYRTIFSNLKENPINQSLRTFFRNVFNKVTFWRR